MKLSPILIAIFALLFASHAEAWGTRLYTDDEVAGRAELVVLAHIKEGSIKKITLGGGSSYEHHAILVISRVIKGEVHEKELPITIAYGLLPVSARQEKHMGPDEDATVRSRPEESGESTRIYEDNPSEGFFRPSGDVHQEQIWLLHRLGASREKNNPEASPADSIGVSAPEDIQPATKEPQLAKLLHVP